MFHWRQVYIWVLSVAWYLIYLIWYYFVFSCLVLHSPILCLYHFEPPFLASIRDCSRLWELGSKSAFVFMLLAFWDRTLFSMLVSCRFLIVRGFERIFYCRLKLSYCKRVLLWIAVAGEVCASRVLLVCLWYAFKKAHSKRFAQVGGEVKCSSFRLKGQEDTPQTVKISSLVGWPYCAEVTPHIGQALRPKTLFDTLAWATGTRVGASDHATELVCILYGCVLGLYFDTLHFEV